MDQVAVVGAGLAGLRACEGLRSRGFEGSIVLIGEEEHAPYDRPPLSKQYLKGEWGLDRVMLRKEDALEGLGLELKRGKGATAVGLDVARSTVELSSGEKVAYDGLVIATGASARRLPGLESVPNSHVLRTLDDATVLAAALSRGARLLVVGAGFIGMEVAATARRLGAEVTVVEPLELPLARALGPLAGRVCADLHGDEGVRLLLSSSIGSVTSSGEGELVAAELLDGTVVEADAVLVGVGAAPNVGWLEGSGLEVSPSGLVCDASLRAGENVVAAGDLVLWPFGPNGLVRLEHRTNAAEQGDHAAATLLGATDPFVPVPYVWSDQYETKIQLLGIPQPDDECVIVDGSLAERRFVGLYVRDGQVQAAVGFSMPRSLMRFRSLVESRAPFDEALRSHG